MQPASSKSPAPWKDTSNPTRKHLNIYEIRHMISSFHPVPILRHITTFLPISERFQPFQLVRHSLQDPGKELCVPITYIKFNIIGHQYAGPTYLRLRLSLIPLHIQQFSLCVWLPPIFGAQTHYPPSVKRGTSIPANFTIQISSSD